MTIDELIAATGLTANDEIPIWDAEATGEPTKKITAQQLATAIVALANLVTSVNGETGAVTLTAEDVNAKATQTAVADPTASGNAVSFIDSITQNEQGVIVPTKKSVPNASTTAPGLMSAQDKGKLDGIPANLIEQLADKASAIVDTANGAIASFLDGAAVAAKDITIGIEPVQAGSGDPSPTNVRPISGWTGANVARTGKNALDIANASIAKPSWYPGGWYGTTKNSKAGITQERGYMDGGAGGFSTTLKPGTTYTISWTYDKALANSCSLFCGSYNGTDQNILADNVTVYSSTNRFSYTLTVPSDSLEIVIRPTVTAAVQSSGQTYDIDYIQIEPGSTATAYEPFSGTTIPISWQSVAGTVYGGTLDVTTGMLTVTHGNIASYNGESLPGKWISSMDVYSAGGTPTTGAQVVYELATSQTYQLTPTEVDMLLGDNNVWADTGDSTVTYRADTKLYIQKINAPTDDDMIADAQIASGKYFIIGGNLYKSTTTIPAGDIITPGSNCILTNLADALNALNT